MLVLLVTTAADADTISAMCTATNGRPANYPNGKNKGCWKKKDESDNLHRCCCPGHPCSCPVHIAATQRQIQVCNHPRSVCRLRRHVCDTCGDAHARLGYRCLSMIWLIWLHVGITKDS